jgi:mRNA-decapping enzyme subunit 2
MIETEITLDDALADVETRFLYNLPETELTSPERLFYQIEQAYWYYEDFKADKFSTLPHFPTLKSFASKIFNHCELLQIVSDGFNKLFADYATYKSKIPVCGCIMLNPGLNKFVLVKDFYSGSWMFPRGKINESETEYECAMREVFEETGFDPRDYCNSQDFVTSFQGEKKIQMFIALNVPEATEFQILTRKEISAIEFHSISNIPQNTFHIHPFMPKLRRFISEKLKQQKKLQKSPRLVPLPTQTTNPNKMKKRSKLETLSKKTGNITILKNEFDQRNLDTFSGNQKRWSVEDMFRANSLLTGRDYTYNGNPHEFGASHPRYVRYDPLKGTKNSNEEMEIAYLQLTEQSASMHGHLHYDTQTGQLTPQYTNKHTPHSLESSTTAAAATSITAAANIGNIKFWRCQLDVGSILQAVSDELKAHPIL